MTKQRLVPGAYYAVAAEKSAGNYSPELTELAEAGADLDLGGHTHDGQLFPGNILTGLMWENACGMKKVGDMYSIVTSGVGLWGPPMRIGTKAEVVIIDYGK